MAIVRELVKAAGCLIAIMLASDLLLTLHDIRNELRAKREASEKSSPGETGENRTNCETRSGRSA